MSTLKVGDEAPDFKLDAQDGTPVNLGLSWEATGRSDFYPMDRTPGCTKQLCAVRDDFARYESAGIAVFGVNNGGAEAHRKFVEQYRLRTPLLVDTGMRVAGIRCGGRLRTGSHGQAHRRRHCL